MKQALVGRKPRFQILNLGRWFRPKQESLSCSHTYAPHNATHANRRHGEKQWAQMDQAITRSDYGGIAVLFNTLLIWLLHNDGLRPRRCSVKWTQITISTAGVQERLRSLSTLFLMVFQELCTGKNFYGWPHWLDRCWWWSFTFSGARRWKGKYARLLDRATVMLRIKPWQDSTESALC